MKNFAELSIDFYSRHEAAVRASFENTDVRLLLYEVTLYSAFIFRQLNNMKGTGVDQVMAQALNEVSDSVIDTFNMGDYINAADIDIKIPALIPYQGKGQKGFDAVLNFVNAASGTTPSLRLNPRGFGILGKEVNYYAVQSINVLLRYFTVKYSKDLPSKYVFSDSSNLCGREYIAGNISYGLSQGEAVARILKRLFPKN